MQAFDADVIVVGAGPTGLMLAGELRLAGVRPLVLERLAEPMKQSRALGFSARTMEEFDQRGLLPQFGDLGVIPIGHFGGMPLDYTIVPGGNFGVRGVPQSFTEAVLARWATGLGAEIRRGWELTALAAGDDGVETEFATPARAACVPPTWWAVTARAAPSAPRPASSSPASTRPSRC